MPAAFRIKFRPGCSIGERTGIPNGISSGAGNLFSEVLVGIQVVVVGCLPFQPQGINDRSVAVDVFELYIVEQSASPADEHQKPPAGMVVLFVYF